MPNTINLFQQYISLLDEVYKQSSKSSVLDMSGAVVTAGTNAHTIVIPKYSMDGLADYSRNGGYVNGDVSVVYENVAFNYDRGRKFTVDAMDNAETAGVAFGQLSSQFIRTKTVPEMDAVRFATYAGKAGAKVTGQTYQNGDDVLAALTVATNAMDEAEVAEESRILFITPTLLTLTKGVETYKSQQILDRFSQIITVPQSRFYTAIDLYDGTTSGEEAGGYVKHVSTGSSDAAGTDINFLIVEKSAAIQFTKHTVNKVFSPEENQNADGWAFVYRAYGLTDVYENRTAGIYLSSK